ncbi:MAG: response regulator transcription factor [Chloroflexi bacterium]|nr:response regulator transcription factor [Chloroflexota bacterium]
MLVDDHELVRTGLKSFLELHDRFKVIGEAANGLDAVALALEMRPDIILMDVAMPILGGLETMRILKSRWREAAVLALAEQEDKYYCMELFAAGASGYLTKHSTSDELVWAIHSIMERQIYLQPALARWLLDDYQLLSEQRREDPPKLESLMVELEILSLRERTVLKLVADGLTNRQIGQSLGLSPKTIARHRERIMGKLKIHSRTELVRFAIRTGVVSLT